MFWIWIFCIIKKTLRFWSSDINICWWYSLYCRACLHKALVCEEAAISYRNSWRRVVHIHLSHRSYGMQALVRQAIADQNGDTSRSWLWGRMHHRQGRRSRLFYWLEDVEESGEELFIINSKRWRRMVDIFFFHLKYKKTVFRI